MRVMQGTLIVVLTLVAIVVLGPFALAALIAGLGDLAKYLLAAVAIFVTIAMWKIIASYSSAMEARRLNQEEALKAGFASYRDYLDAGAHAKPEVRDALANRAGFADWNAFAENFRAGRERGETRESLFRAANATPKT